MAKLIKHFAYVASRRIVKTEIRRHAGKSPKDSFRDSWTRLLSRPMYRLLMRVNERPTKEGMQVKGKTFELLSAGIPDFFQGTRINVSDSLKAAIDGGEAFVALHLHDGHCFFERPFLDGGRELTRIATDPARYVDMLRRLGMDVSRVHAIRDDVLSLAHLRDAIRANHVVCHALDYQDAKGLFSYINPAIFSLANSSKTPVYFCKSHVDGDGNPEIISDGPYVDVDPMACAKTFLAFFNSAGDSRVSMKIRRYIEHEDWRTHERYETEKAAGRLSLPLN